MCVYTLSLYVYIYMYIYVNIFYIYISICSVTTCLAASLCRSANALLEDAAAARRNARSGDEFESMPAPEIWRGLRSWSSF